ncbi:transmembrane protein 35B-like [Diadema setosum]|uniref:transmembrane protein 35B-like n=1 Tax=Diadema setosum TaxID=31175 RepID=UPI003B3ABE39
MANGMYYLAVGLGLFAVLMGTLKVAPIEPAHGTQVSLMSRCSGVFPLKAVGFQPSAAMYCAMIAVLEIAFGSLLAFGRYDWPVISGTVLMVLSVIHLHARLALGDPPADLLLPAILLVLDLLLLFSRDGLWRGYGKVHLA